MLIKAITTITTGTAAATAAVTATATLSSKKSRCITSLSSSIVNSQIGLPQLRIVAFNDVYELKNLPMIQTLIGQKRPNIVVLAGDFLSPSTLSSVDGGKGMITTLRSIGLTHCCLGNHEADLHLSKLYKRLRKLGQTVTIVNSNIGRGPFFEQTTPSPVDLLKIQQQLQQTPDWLRGNSSFDNSSNSSSSQQQQQQQQQKHDNSWMPEYSIVTTPCQRVKIALLGLLSDEPGMFRDGTFRGTPIANVIDTYQHHYHQLTTTKNVANFIIPMTHQSIQRDEELARSMIQISKWNGIILGGHEHIPYNTTITESIPSTSSSVTTDDEVTNVTTTTTTTTNRSVQILKAGCEAKAVNLIDLTFDLSTEEVLVDQNVELIELNDMDYPPSVVVTQIVKERMAVLDALETEDIVHAGSLLPPGATLSSKGTRYRQTTVGSIFCTAIKEELEVDVAIINGATIKGETEYSTTSMSYASLKKELPFPTKIVVVPMKRWELHDAIYYSRTRHPDITSEEEIQKQMYYNTNNHNNNYGNDNNIHSVLRDDSSKSSMKNGTPDIYQPVERKGYIQVDTEFDRIGFHTGDQDDDLMVALPRNLLNGFCTIEPLMQVGNRLKEQNQFPADDDHIRGIDLIVRHFCKERWFEMIHEMQFTDIDTDKKGYLSRSDVKRILQETIGHEPASFLVDDMIAAMDVDENGIIDAGEFSYLLATMERERAIVPVRFD